MGFSMLVRQHLYIDSGTWTSLTCTSPTRIALTHNSRIGHPPPRLLPLTFGKWLLWWRHKMETYSALLAFCEGNSPVTGEFPSLRPVTWYFEFFFDLHLNKRLGKHYRRWGFETPSRSLWRHCNEILAYQLICYHLTWSDKIHWSIIMAMNFINTGWDNGVWRVWCYAMPCSMACHAII